MIFDSDKALLKRYRHIIAALIVYSIGYFTPLAAFKTTINGLKMASNQETGETSGIFDIVCVMRGTVNLSVRRIRVVDQNIDGHESLGASWF